MNAMVKVNDYLFLWQFLCVRARERIDAVVVVSFHFRFDQNEGKKLCVPKKL